MTPREQLDGMMGDLRGEMDRLRKALEAKEKENADLRDRVMRECEEIVDGEDCISCLQAIRRARKEGK